MRTVVDMLIDAHRLPGGAAELLRKTDCGPDVATLNEYDVLDVHYQSVKLVLQESDPRVKRVLEYLEKCGEDPLVSRYDQFTEEERQVAPLLRMLEDANEHVYGGAEYGTKYDMANACPTCGTGARQSSPLYVWWKHLERIRKHRAIGCEQGGIILDLGLENKLKAAGVTGASFGEVYGRLKNNKRTLVARQQIIIENSLPPISPTSEIDFSKACPTCRRGGLETRGLRYRRKALANMSDFNLTWEWFGPFDYKGDLKKSRLSTRAILVTPKVMNIFRDAGVTTFDWIPIFVED